MSDATIPDALVVRLSDDTRLLDDFLICPWAKVRVGDNTLSRGGVARGRLTELAEELGGRTDAVARADFLLAALDRTGMLSHTVMASGEALATAGPRSKHYRTRFVASAPGERMRLSRFATMRRDGDTLVAESPLSAGRLVLHTPSACAAVAALAAPRSAAELAALVPEIQPDGIALLLGLLLGLLLAEAEAAPRPTIYPGKERQTIVGDLRESTLPSPMLSREFAAEPRGKFRAASAAQGFMSAARTSLVDNSRAPSTSALTPALLSAFIRTYSNVADVGEVLA